MRIGVNLLPLVPGVVGGIQQHLIGLLDNLLEVDQDTSYVYYVTFGLAKLFPKDNPRIRLVELPRNSKEIAQRYTHGEFDVLFAPMMDPSVDQYIFPMVTLIVDLQHVYYPQFFSEAEITHRRLHWEWPARAAHTVCVSTEFVADSVTKHLDIPRSRIILTPPPINKSIYGKNCADLPDAIPSSLIKALPAKYLFYPSNTWPHKNHLNLLLAISIIKKKHNDIHLVLTGWPQKAHKSIKRRIKELNLDDSITWLGYVQDECMPYIYSHATALVFPSLFEGFGIPLLEAMHSNCPIICSSTTSCPEVAGDAAIYFDPDDSLQIHNAIEIIWTDSFIRERLIRNGLARCNEFDNHKQAKLLLSKLQDAASEFGPPAHLSKHISPDKTETTSYPLVSIIMPSYQQGQFIKEAIDSVLAQDYPNIECIIVDGGSDDETLDILKSYGTLIQWISEPDNGQGHAINKGLSMSSGLIIGWLNSDDLYQPKTIERTVSLLMEKSGCWLAYGEANYIDEQGNNIGRYPTDTYSVTNLLRHCCICQPTVFFHRRLYEIGGDIDESFFMAMDYELWLRYSKITPLLYIPEVLASSRIHPQTKTSRYRTLSIKESMTACRRHYGHTSPLWCMQYAKSRAEKIPLISSWRKIRKPVQAAIFVFIFLLIEAPYHAKKIVRMLLMALR
ncbi:MAG: glycosyltransferase [Sedimenticola sp.]